jgi:exopolysaccharide production protein ExoZ
MPGLASNTAERPAATAKPGKLLGIEAVRGLAALLVTLFHGSHVILLATGNNAPPFAGFFGFGHAGVPFFFVLSGFIIFFVHRSDIGQALRLGEFAWRRVTRIYPLFLVVMLPVTLKTIAAGAFRWDHFICSLLLLPQAEWPMLIPAWTLMHEALFYLLFALAIWRARLGRLVLLGWLCLFVGALIVSPDLGRGFIGNLGRALLSPYNLLFLLGVGVAWIVQRGALRFARLLAVLGALAFIATGMVEIGGVFPALTQGSLALVLLYGVSSMLIITGLAAAERAGTLAPGRLAGMLGAMSYPLYLTHGMTISIVMTLAGWSRFKGPDWLLLLLATALACGAAMLVHFWIEVPIALYLKRVHDRRRARLPLASEALP